jgi:hypothetical protein
MEAMADPGRRVLAAFLALMIVLGSLVLWIGVPIAGFWAAGQLFTESTRFLMFVLLTVPLTMVAFGFGLYRLNALYMSLRDQEPGGPRPRSGWLVSNTDERRSSRLKRGPRQLIDVAMTASIVAALVLMIVWFFFLAEMRLAPLP